MKCGECKSQHAQPKQAVVADAQQHRPVDTSMLQRHSRHTRHNDCLKLATMVSVLPNYTALYTKAAKSEETERDTISGRNRARLSSLGNCAAPCTRESRNGHTQDKFQKEYSKH